VETAKRVERLALLHKLTVNRQASGLRTGKSGLIGMLIPLHDNRFFSALAQVFERLARERRSYPIVVTTLRDPHLEVETVNALISYRIEYLVVTGATDPDSVSRACRHHGVAHVNVDLPGTSAASVISDNYRGTEQLTKALIARSRPLRSGKRNRAYFLGGIASDCATRRRIQGFSDIVKASSARSMANRFDACG
jgi:LacI family transcriptional regulator, fructose operon transcriptional repressor